MKKVVIAAMIGLFVAGFATVSHADLDGFLSSLNVQAQADLPGFKAKLSAQFGVPLPTVETIFAEVRMPGDVFMCLQLGEFAHKTPQVVVQRYQRSKKKGWGALAQELGIKPGSREFHALKSGNLQFTGEPSAASKGKNGGKGKAKK
jgi:hypothetical protein